MRCLDALVDGALVEVRLSPGDGRETGPATRLTGAGQRSGSGFNPCLYFFALHFFAQKKHRTDRNQPWLSCGKKMRGKKMGCKMRRWWDLTLDVR